MNVHSIDRDQIIASQRSLHTEAEALLAKYSLVEKLSKYGTVKFDGSYEFNLMTSRDVDIEITIEDAFDQRDQLTSDIVTIPGVYKVQLVDNVIRKSPEGRPAGVYYGVELLYDDRIWTFDIWAIPKSSPRLHRDITPEDEACLKSLTADQRAQLLKVKSINDARTPKTPSVMLYRAYLAGLQSDKA